MIKKNLTPKKRYEKDFYYTKNASITSRKRI
jgi:hypothetical protein